jgi:hypothetical protein
MILNTCLCIWTFVGIIPLQDNLLGTRTGGTVALMPSGKYHGSLTFFSFNLGRSMLLNQWIQLPVPMEGITGKREESGEQWEHK